MSSAKARLTHLLDLADRGPSLRAALAVELIDLLLDEPADIPPAMRTTFETLLEKAARDLAPQAREQLMARLDHDVRHPLAALILPPDILNMTFFDAPPALKARIVARNFLSDDRRKEAAPAQDNSEEMPILQALRDGAPVAIPFGRSLALPATTAGEILGDASAWSLAVACKGAHLHRTVFSALTLLSIPATDTADLYGRLAIYDDVPAPAAERLLQSWRAESALAHAAQ